MLSHAPSGERKRAVWRGVETPGKIVIVFISRRKQINGCDDV